MKNESTPGPMKAWLVEKEGHTPGCKIEPETLGVFRKIGYTVTPCTLVPCPEGLQYGGRVVHEAGFRGRVAGAIDAFGRLYVRGDDGLLNLCEPKDLTPIPDEPERTYTEDEAKAIKRLQAWAANPYEGPEAEIARDVKAVLARLREQGGDHGS